MGIEDDAKVAQTGVAVVGELIKLAGKDPNVAEAASNLGKTALTVTKAINVALLPIAALNFGFDRAKAYFETRFASDLSEKAKNIPPDKVVEPKASIAGPALQGLAFTHEEPDLKDMYLNLLSSAMDARLAPKAHPAFVEIIKQINSQEAPLLRTLISNGFLPICEIRLKTPGVNGWKLLYNHLLNWVDTNSGEAKDESLLPPMIDNFIRLGLITVEYGTFLEGEGIYNWAEQRPEFISFKEQQEPFGKSVVIQRGVMLRTGLGFQFAQAVGLIETNSPS